MYVYDMHTHIYLGTKIARLLLLETDSNHSLPCKFGH
jgi:hypothetical protein